MQIVIVGGSGFVGQHLAKRLLAAGHEVWIPTRGSHSVPHGQTISYKLNEMGALLSKLKSPYAIVNLAGESINSGRWTAKRKEAILQSRLEVTHTIVRAIKASEQKPEVLINASAIGFYGYSNTATFTESSPSGHGFLADVTREWEQAASKAAPHTRVVLARLGVVLGANGGALPRMVLPYYGWIGGRVGSGRQLLSWIHIDDVAGIIEHCLTDQRIHGPVNVTAPEPITMDQFGRKISQTLHRPHWLAVPSFALKFLLGEMAEIVLQGQFVLPQVMQSYGYTFTYPTADQALQEIYKK
ncbi:TIGR01777 family oxidoreductase [Brevibacillus ginsengisoli]|uniref:TIGR01777 family oxidoreductase n=1 Tax=Brevibacillus ginsengisoli TaxID=363854 RepID=UPI003CEE3277